MNVTVSLPRTLVDGVVTELRAPVTDAQRVALEGLAESLLWQARVVLAASLAEANSVSEAPKKRRGRPRKAAAPATNGSGNAPKRRGRPRKVQPAVESAPVTEQTSIQ